MKFQIVTVYRDSHLQRYGVTVRGNVTACTHPPLAINEGLCSTELYTRGVSKKFGEWYQKTKQKILTN
jgi:hypothetical protein